MATERTLPNLWHATAPAAPETRPLSQDLTTDVAIIGGGFTGLSAALHLAVGSEGVTEIKDREAQWQKRGAPVEALSAERAHALTGAEGFSGALLDRRAGTIQPLAYARG